jgi:uncharacterized protein
MKIVVTGSHGMIGSALVPALESAGHEVVRLVRGTPGPGEVAWDPEAGVLDATDLAGADGTVHLAGEGIAAKRWTPEQKRRVLDSRVKSTDLLSRRLAELDPKPSVLVAGSAVGFYGDRGSEELDEQSKAGTGFLVGLCQQWEAATAPAEQARIRVVHIRTGIVLSPTGGVLKKQLPLFKIGVGGRLGSGRQYQSWISLDDEVGAIAFALNVESLSGPVNLTSPNPVTNAEYTKALGAVLGRPTIFPVPRLALSAILGVEATDEMLLGGQRVLPRKLQENGYAFAHPDLEPALRALLSR